MYIVMHSRFEVYRHSLHQKKLVVIQTIWYFAFDRFFPLCFVFSRGMTSVFLASSYFTSLVKFYFKSIVDWNFLINKILNHITHNIIKIFIRIYIFFSIWIPAKPLKSKIHCTTASPICLFLRNVGVSNSARVISNRPTLCLHKQKI